MKILFWDIDGTLMRTDRAGLYAFQQAIAELLNAKIDLSSIKTAGMTDCYISEQVIRVITGRDAEPHEVAALIKRYEEVLPHHLAARKGQLMPNIRELLDHFHGHRDFVSLLLTGNTSLGAKAKLSKYSIAQYFDFSISAFGDNCPDRLDLAANALSKATGRYPGIKREDMFVIGDTPNDIRCGKSIDAKTIAVATGSYPVEELIQHTPWWAVDNLPEPSEFEKKLMTI
ncbi:Pyrophosphatase PpaX [bioreactor metagenome]|uniref:Pyrophosphatase PpaX n=1 Tax=bioreactor metagenome TaxID=1076179 RepID=A0A645B879_9ZZZZ